MKLFKAEPRKKDSEDTHPLVQCPGCGELHKRRRSGMYCDMSCYHRELRRSKD